MQTVKHLSIPEPCSQNWDEMIPNTSGRHCAQCCKTVTDFTVMTNQQIIDMLANVGNICGKIESWQLESVNKNIAVQYKSSLWKNIVVAATMLFAMLSFKSYGQSKGAAKKHSHIIVADKKRWMTDSLNATYTNPQADLAKVDNTEVKPRVIEIAPASLNTLIGGIIVGVKIEETTHHFKSIYDMLINLR